ncbi:hypothetical protein B9Z55_020624 [Caenorhabditis nigoni]|uniref:Uncharacterized protein n=1 Tax=Caenorhabditis nigoni TaxID=1611254 RepID=A0A2G5TNH8_9PELO|nr:hypothetical protein B9Z55_020624 [Caenorhabditis nigoni]
MFNRFVILFGSLIFFAVAAPAPTTERETFDELRLSGMSEKGILALHNLAVKFKYEYAKVARSKKATDKLMADFTIIGKGVVNSMSQEDQEVYNSYVEKYGLS